MLQRYNLSLAPNMKILSWIRNLTGIAIIFYFLHMQCFPFLQKENGLNLTKLFLLMLPYIFYQPTTLFQQNGVDMRGRHTFFISSVQDLQTKFQFSYKNKEFFSNPVS